MPADGSWDRYEDGRKALQTHESEIVFRAAGLSVVEAVDVHVHFLNFLGTVIGRVCRVDSGYDGDDHFGCQHRAVAALDALRCDAEDLHKVTLFEHRSSKLNSGLQFHKYDHPPILPLLCFLNHFVHFWSYMIPLKVKQVV